MLRTTIQKTAAVAVTLTLVACGGGGGNGGGGGSATISGTVTFDRVPATTTPNGLNYDGTVSAPVRGATVQAVEGNTVHATGVTDASGGYTLSVPGNRNVFIRVLAELKQSGATSWDVSVVDNTNNGALYALDGPTTSTGTGASTRDLNAPSGWDGSGYSAPRAAGPFAMLDSVYSTVTKFAAADPNAQFPALNINWSVNNVPTAGDRAMGQIGTSFYDPGSKALFILGAENADTDEYDDHVIIHEWGHYFEDQLSRSDSVGGPHGDGERLDMRVAFGEGFGNALSGIITDDPLYVDTQGNQQTGGFNFNLDNNVNNNPGWYSEGSVQSILYDLYDSNDDGMDSVSLGLGPLHQVLIGEQRTTSALTSIFSFVAALKDANSGVANAIDVLVSAQNITVNDAFGSGETNDAGNADDVLPIYSPLALNIATQNVCSISDFGSPQLGRSNKLSVRRFLRLNITSAVNYRISASGPAGSDPEIIVHRDGVIVGVTQQQPGPTDMVELPLDTGEHIIEIYEFSNLGIQGQTARGRTCFDVLAQ